MTWVWAACAFLVLAGLAGVLLPVLPGPSLILAAAVLHKLYLPGYLSWWTVALVALLALVEAGLGALGAAAGARWAGASRWGIAGAGAGLLLGLGFGLPGLLLGPLAGAALAELAFARRTWDQAARAAVGAGLGLAASTLGRMAIALAMVAVLLADCFLIG